MGKETWDLESPLGVKLAEIDIEIEFWESLINASKPKPGWNEVEPVIMYRHFQNMRDLAMEKRYRLKEYNN